MDADAPWVEFQALLADVESDEELADFEQGRGRDGAQPDIAPCLEHPEAT